MCHLLPTLTMEGKYFFLAGSSCHPGVCGCCKSPAINPLQFVKQRITAMSVSKHFEQLRTLTVSTVQPTPGPGPLLQLGPGGLPVLPGPPSASSSHSASTTWCSTKIQRFKETLLSPVVQLKALRANRRFKKKSCNTIRETIKKLKREYMKNKR